MAVIKGAVKALAKNGTGFMVDDVWYNVDNEEALDGMVRGSTVKFNSVSKKIKGRPTNQVVGEITITGTTAKPTTTTVSRRGRDPSESDRIVRQNALTNAVAFVNEQHSYNDAESASIEEVLETAATFYAFTSGAFIVKPYTLDLNADTDTDMEDDAEEDTDDDDFED